MPPRPRNIVNSNSGSTNIANTTTINSQRIIVPPPVPRQQKKQMYTYIDDNGVIQSYEMPDEDIIVSIFNIFIPQL